MPADPETTGVANPYKQHYEYNVFYMYSD